jgi:superfamily II DNA/RNA helicase
MKHQAGVWIDHRKARIVTVTPDGQHASQVVSNVEKHPQRAADAVPGPYEALQESPDDRRQRALTKHLNTYYDTVIAAIRDARSIYVCGPGESKLELKKRLAKQSLGTRVAALESADRMTDRQFIAKVRGFFRLDAPRREPKLRPVLK